MDKICECCKRKEIIGNNKWCSSCAVYIKEIKRHLAYYKHKSIRLNRLFIGKSDGRQCLSVPNELKGQYSKQVKRAFELGKESGIKSCSQSPKKPKEDNNGMD